MAYLYTVNNRLGGKPQLPPHRLTSSRGDGHGDRRLMAVGFFVLSSFEVIFSLGMGFSYIQFKGFVSLKMGRGSVSQDP